MMAHSTITLKISENQTFSYSIIPPKQKKKNYITFADSRQTPSKVGHFAPIKGLVMDLYG
jgi:hypothetical protein